MRKLTQATAAAGAALASSAGLAFAQVSNPLPFTRFSDLINVVFNIIIAAVGIVALFMIVVGGFKYMTSGGDKFDVQAAQGTITAGLVGLVIVLVAWLIINVVGTVLGRPGLFSFPY